MTGAKIRDAKTDYETETCEAYEWDKPNDPFFDYVLKKIDETDNISLLWSTVRLHDGTGNQPAGIEVSYRYSSELIINRNKAPGLKRALEREGFTVEYKKDARCRRGRTDKAVIITGHEMLGGNLPETFLQD